MQRQSWHLQDLVVGGGLGFTVEIFFLALSQLLSTSPSKDSHSALHTGTFLVITPDEARQQFESSGSYNYRRFLERMLRVLTGAVNGFVTFPCGIQNFVQRRHLMIQFMATCGIHLVVLSRLRERLELMEEAR
jgi:hypothetical protein